MGPLIKPDHKMYFISFTESLTLDYKLDSKFYMSQYEQRNINSNIIQSFKKTQNQINFSVKLYHVLITDWKLISHKYLHKETKYNLTNNVFSHIF